MQYICSKTGDEGSIYAARQGMRAVYMQQDRRSGQYICTKTGHQGSIYAARQEIRAVSYMQQEGRG